MAYLPAIGLFFWFTLSLLLGVVIGTWIKAADEGTKFLDADTGPEGSKVYDLSIYRERQFTSRRQPFERSASMRSHKGDFGIPRRFDAKR